MQVNPCLLLSETTSLLPLSSILRTLASIVGAVLDASRHGLETIAGLLGSSCIVNRVAQTLACSANNTAHGFSEATSCVAEL